MRAFTLSVIVLFGIAGDLLAGGESSADFQPDPKSVQRSGAAYRYPQAGWIVLHIEGEPYERGYQHGKLLAPEIAAHLRCMAAIQSPKAPEDGWKHARKLVNALFVRRYEKEYLEEMKGIADGANAAGARFYGKPIDLVDIVGINSWPEIETLDSALEATATGLESKTFPKPELREMPKPKPMHCSAFAATGPATADGKIVFGHITMFSLYPSSFYNVWLDVKPAKGHRVFMQSYPGGIQSGMDYYFNDAGLLVSETTLAQTKFDIKGMTVASRIRQALQYADSIDKAVEILGKENNGLYTNEWLLADTKTNEIAMYELGTAKSRLYRSSKNEWFGGTEGFYWGCNNTKDLDVRLETIASLDGRPGNPVFCPSPREKVWLKLYEKHNGKIGVDFGKEAFTTPIIAAAPSLDAKFTTTDLAKELKTWALFGPPLGKSWDPTQKERERYPEVQPLVSNPWTVLTARAPEKESTDAIAAVDLIEPIEGETKEAKRKDKDDGEEEMGVESGPAWHGTLLPKSDADIWLATAFSDYERYYSLEKRLRQASAGKLTDADRDRLAVERYGYRSSYLAAARASSDVQLDRTKPEPGDDKWYRIAAGKGFWILHQLRQSIAKDEEFENVMDAFGRKFAGRQVTERDFLTFLKEAKVLDGEQVSKWRREGATSVSLEPPKTSFADGKYRLTGLVRGPSPKGAGDDDHGTRLHVTVETESGEEAKEAVCGTQWVMETSARPKRVLIDKYGADLKANGGVYSLTSFYSELDQTLIVYGTGDEAAANREAAEALQKLIITRFSNLTVPIKTDKDVPEQDLKNHHLLLIGRPDCNSLVEKFRAKLPVQFGSRSFTARGDCYAHAGSAVIAATENPANNRFSVVVIAGLSATATERALPRLFEKGSAEVLVLPKGREPKPLVMPAPELVYEIKQIEGK
jgi:hypothetical protein